MKCLSKKSSLLLLTISLSFALSGCFPRFEKDGLIYKIGDNDKTYIVDFSEELLDDEIIYIPSSVRNFANGQPMPLVIGPTLSLAGSLSSDALRILYVTGGQTGFDDQWDDNLDNLEMVVFNTLSPTYLPDLSRGNTFENILKYFYILLYSHESFDSVVQYYDSKWDAEIKPQDWPPPAATLPSRASYYFNYEGSPNEGLYRIGMEYEIGSDLTPPDDPTRDGYQFIGWSSDATTFIPYDFESSDDDINVQLYAHWE